MQVPGIGAFLLVHLEHLQAFASGNHRSHVDGIAMSEACAIEQRTIVVQCCRAPYHFIASVTIDIANREVMVAVGKHGSAAAAAGGFQTGEALCRALALGIVGSHCVFGCLARGVQPLGIEFLSVEAHSPDEGIAIVATAEDAAGRLVGAFKIGYGGQIALAAVAIRALIALVVRCSPVERAFCFAQFRRGIARGVIGNGVYGASRQTLEHGEIFMSAIHATVRVEPHLGVRCGFNLVVGSGLVHIVALSV